MALVILGSQGIQTVFVVEYQNKEIARLKCQNIVTIQIKEQIFTISDQ
jgi:hypothetical protein